MTGIRPVILGSLAIAALSTVGDFVWATWLPEHRMVYGLTHGTLLFLAIGHLLGDVSGRRAAGTIGGAAIGFVGAGTFYLLAPVVGFLAMFVAWIGIWIALAMLYGRLRGHPVSTGAVVSRGIIAAAASGLAFYAISGIWRPFNPQGLDYLVHFGTWTVAYLPGFAALLLSRSPRGG